MWKRGDIKTKFLWRHAVVQQVFSQNYEYKSTLWLKEDTFSFFHLVPEEILVVIYEY